MFWGIDSSIAMVASSYLVIAPISARSAHPCTTRPPPSPIAFAHQHRVSFLLSLSSSAASARCRRLPAWSATLPRYIQRQPRPQTSLDSQTWTPASSTALSTAWWWRRGIAESRDLTP
ncbi:hypothetical protein FA95DRAFT_1373988 [Auriscalpium vulgare]|uniref:Uncharacterized protein n=1 Tax=Auriscalpium vulgare TaxID=40419 RepID=A0ACB8RQU0_9AGAM|nr:hypothetical protein FA95DRAFT_1373988 [Auriscalpium vulgare]